MTESELICRIIGVVLTRAEVSACAFLEQRKYRFCVDFGYQNAIDKAAELYAKELEQQMTKGRP